MSLGSNDFIVEADEVSTEVNEKQKQPAWLQALLTYQHQLNAAKIPSSGLYLQQKKSGSKQVKGQILLSEVQQIMLVGEASLLREFRVAMQHDLKDVFSAEVNVYGSVYGPMQCMLKGVCAQCLQWQINPQTGERTKAVYACSWQQQPLQKIDIDHIDQRLMQNQCLETLSDAWLTHILA